MGCGGWLFSKGTLGSNNGLGLGDRGERSFRSSMYGFGDDGGDPNNSTGVSFGGRDGDGVLEG